MLPVKRCQRSWIATHNRRLDVEQEQFVGDCIITQRYDSKTAANRQKPNSRYRKFILKYGIAASKITF
jgi:hypothetical protein